MTHVRRVPAPGSRRPSSGAPIIDATDIAMATLPLSTSEKPWRSISIGPSHRPRSVMNDA